MSLSTDFPKRYDNFKNMAPCHSTLYAELRRMLRNKFARLAILMLLCMGIVSMLHPARSYADSLQDTLSSKLGLNGLGGIKETTTSQHKEESKGNFEMLSEVGKVHAVFGEPNPVYERALQLHEKHSEIHGHPMFVLRERLLSGLWSKPAYILSVMMRELEKPEHERLQWLLWIDADIVVMNPEIPLDIFIPPAPEFNYVNMLVTNDKNGLNNGCFLIKVNSWSVKLLSATIAFHIFRPDVELKYSEQSALEQMVNEKYWRNSVVKVPQHWFNAFPSNRSSTAVRPQDFRPGALHIHFAGNKDGKRPERMETWMNIAEQASQPYTCPLEKTGLEEDIQKFWDHLSEERTKKGIKPITD